jgi:mycothiol synthase
LLTIREPGPADAERIAELMNALAESLGGEQVATAAEIRHWLSLTDVEFRIAEAADDELVAYADVIERAERTRYWLDLREHPARRELGGARALLTAAEGRARQRAADGALLRGTFSTEDGALRALYEQAGFHFVRHDLEMEIELSGNLAPPKWPRGTSVRTFGGEDAERVHAAHMESFEDHWEHVHEPLTSWRQEHLARGDFDPSLWFLAEEAGEIAGLCLCRPHASGDPTIGYVEVLGVRRSWRRRGLGLALLHHAFHAFRDRGMTRAALDVDAESLTGAVRVYERAGMHVSRRSETYEKALGAAVR